MKLRKPRILPDKFNRIATDYAAGMKIALIIRRYHCSATTIYKAIGFPVKKYD